MNKYTKAKSIHMFAWPFKVEDTKNTMEEKGWRKKQLDYRKVADAEQCKEAYMLEQYLSMQAREIFVDSERDICTVYEYPLDQLKEYTYYIEVDEGHIYNLPIAEIEMHVYQCGVGVLFFKVLNMDQNTTLEDIKLINDKGRRVYLPFIPNEPEISDESEDSDKSEQSEDAEPKQSRYSFGLCAHKLGIKVGRRKLITDYQALVQQFYEKKLSDKSELSRQARFLDATLNCELEAEILGDISVIPAIDDRMFVISLVRDDMLSRDISDKKRRKHKECKEKIYTIFYVDDGSSTCQCKDMLDELLEKASYKRWIDRGTIYGVTNYSLVCVTSESEEVDVSVVKPFWVEYLYFVSLAIAQRQGIMRFATEAGRYAQGLDLKEVISRAKARELVCLQEEYVTFKNQLLILEASCQEQGIDIYQKLQRQLLVEEEKDFLDGQLNSIYEIANVSNGTRANNISFVWAIWVFILDIVLDIALDANKRNALVGCWDYIKDIIIK